MLRLVFVIAALVFACPIVRAQVAVQQWHPTTSAGGFVALESPSSPVGYGVGTSLWFQYAHEPVVLPSLNKGEAVVVSDQITIDATATVGVFSWLALAVGLPVTLYQGGASDTFDVRRAGFGDPRLLAKFTLLRPGGKIRGLGLALMPEMGLPFGDPVALIGEQNFTFTPRLALAYSLGYSWWVLNVGYRFREGALLGDLFLDDELSLAAGVEIEIPRVPLAAMFEVVGATAAVRPFFALKETSVEALFSMRGRMGPIALQPGLAIGLTPGYLVPDYRVFVAVAFASRHRDADGDGVKDIDDRCMDAREDLDGFQDGDGCPDVDNDDDGVPDRVDRCPDAPGLDEYAGCAPH